MKLGTNVLVKVNYNRPGYVVAVRGDYIKAKNEILESEKKLEEARIKRLNNIIG